MEPPLKVQYNNKLVESYELATFHETTAEGAI